MHPFILKYLVYYLLVLAGLGLLFSRRIKRWNRSLVLLSSFLVLGGVVILWVPQWERDLGMHPSPLCMLGRLLQMAIVRGVYPKLFIVGLAVILGLSLIGKKLFCGWACPVGALQELIYTIPGVKKIANLPFYFTNWIRTYIFMTFVLGLGLYGVYLYNGINAFELLHWELDYPEVTLGIGLLGLTAFFYYRPYCYLVCPIGLASWALERASLLGVRFQKEHCTSCHVCLKTAPCPALEKLINEQKGWLPDCTSCGLCLDACPEKALNFGLRK
jgi:polyferredoxin